MDRRQRQNSSSLRQDYPIFILCHVRQLTVAFLHEQGSMSGGLSRQDDVAASQTHAKPLAYLAGKHASITRSRPLNLVLNAENALFARLWTYSTCSANLKSNSHCWSHSTRKRATIRGAPCVHTASKSNFDGRSDWSQLVPARCSHLWPFCVHATACRILMRLLLKLPR